MNEHDILQIIKEDDWMMEILKTARKLDLPDWWIGAGFVRSKVWDTLHKYKTRTPIPDIDVIYFDKNNFSEDGGTINTIKQHEKEDENILKQKLLQINWSVTNQARMHLFHHHKPYNNSTEALSQWVETATCIGVTLDKSGKLILTAPRGIEDLVNLKLRPTPDNKKDPKTFYERINKKEWLKKWPRLQIV